MRMWTFAGRNAKEILRDPLNLAFGLGFPLVLIGLLTAIQANVPVPLFEIGHLAPGISVFALAFLRFARTAVCRKFLFFPQGNTRSSFVNIWTNRNRENRYEDLQNLHGDVLVG